MEGLSRPLTRPEGRHWLTITHWRTNAMLDARAYAYAIGIGEDIAMTSMATLPMNDKPLPA